jgi:putative FmdB family regulatory protein
MPIYEYKCTKCGRLFELLQKINDPPLSKCLQCGGRAVKTVSAPAIQFKGNGWYVTDYANKEKNKAAPKTPPASTPDNQKKAASKKAAQQKKE